MAQDTPSSPQIDHPHTVLTESEAAAYVGFTRAALRAWRRRGCRTRGPAFIRFSRSVRYLKADLDGWLVRHRVEPRSHQEDH